MERRVARLLYGVVVTGTMVATNLLAVGRGHGAGHHLGLSFLFAIAAMILHEALFERGSSAADAADAVAPQRVETRLFLAVVSAVIMIWVVLELLFTGVAGGGESAFD
jgi:hypothetical protein